MPFQDAANGSAAELLGDYHASEAAFKQSRADLHGYLGTLVGSNISIKGFPALKLIATQVSPGGKVMRRTSVPGSRLSIFAETEKDVMPVKPPIELKNALLDSVSNSELRILLVDIEPPVRHYQLLGYVMRFPDIVSLEPVPVLVET